MAKKKEEEVVQPEEVLDETSIEEPAEEQAEEQVEEQPTEETEDPKDEEQEVSDSVKAALEEKARLKAELEELKSSTTNVFEENEVLKAELEEQKQLAKMAEENAAMKAQLDAIKRGTLVEGLIATGRIPKDLKEWAGTLTNEQLEEFNAKAPKPKTILDEKNNAEEASDEEMEKWYKSQMKSRIL